MNTPSRLWRTLLVVIFTAVGLLMTASASGAPVMETSDGGTAKVDGSVRRQIEAKGATDFWVVLRGEADLSGAEDRESDAAKARFVRNTKIEHARESQAGLKQLLEQNKGHYTSFESFWISNAILVEDGDGALMDKIAARPEVKSVEADTPITLEKPLAGKAEATVNGVEWNVDRINAPQVWSQFGTRGEDIVVASIDSGVDYTHAAIVNQYRGNLGNGGFDHNYNFFDPANICDAEEPCDNNGHGTHTMGTMVGDDGDGNQIGVAPGAKWIAAKGCESSQCSTASLLAAGQWILAPTDLNGQNPRPELAPDVVNNSWGGGGGEFWYQSLVRSWVAAGIFPSFANGNAGPGCGTARSPGDLPESYASGAFDINNQIASFSSRGPGPNGEIKPDIASPGVNVRSSVPGGGYGSASGTSMATPHTTAAVALIWSAAPALRGNVADTEAILDQTAIDTPDNQCGGTDTDNNVWGEGRLDVLAAVLQSPRGDLGAASGHVSADGAPLSGATVTFDGPMRRVRTTAADGSYSVNALVVGEYTVTVENYGYRAVTQAVTVVKDQTTTADFTLQTVPMGTLHGQVVDGSGHGWPLHAKITISGNGYRGDPVNTDQTGAYSITVAIADKPYVVRVSALYYPGYLDSSDQVLVAATNVIKNVALSVDPVTCRAPGYDWNGTSAGFTGWTGITAQDGWSVTGSRSTWQSDNPGHRTPPKGGDNQFVIADSNYFSHGRLDTTLVSPVVNLSGQSAPELSFDTAYYGYAKGETADVDLSLDGGESWTTIWHQDTRNALGHVALPVPQAANHATVRVRFHYTGRNAGWWALDNVFLGTHTCVPIAGGLVEGTVTGTAGQPVVGASITSNDRPREFGISIATPDDPNLPDGYYWLFSSLTGGHRFTAAASGYAPSTATVSVTPNQITRRDWALTG